MAKATPAAALIPLTLALSPEAVARLEILTDAYNKENGTALSLTEWITLHLREVAIGREWSASVQLLQAQLEAANQAAVRQERERLLGLV